MKNGDGTIRRYILFCCEKLLRVRMQYKQIASVVRNPKWPCCIKAPGRLRSLRLLLVTYADSTRKASPKMQDQRERLFVRTCPERSAKESDW